jgi:hypothetical protein
VRSCPPALTNGAMNAGVAVSAPVSTTAEPPGN